jgi:S1-C subfamily serine protease
MNNQIAPAGTNVTLPELFNRVKDSVVEINVIGEIPNHQVIVNDTPLGQPFTGSGSGFVYDREGHVVTNYHVIQDSKVVFVRFLDGNSYLANITGGDIYSDLAVLTLDPVALSREQIKPLPLTNSSLVQVGEPAFAIGSPAGLTGSMTQGIISQTNRVQHDIFTGRFWVGDLLQTDAPITHGSSGGPLLNLNGQVLGVTERGVANTEAPQLLSQPGIGLVISSNMIKRIVPQLISSGLYHHPWLGISVTDVTPILAAEIGLEASKGVLISNVTSGSPADASGIKIGTNDTNIILGIDGRTVREKSDLINYLGTKSPGQTVILTLFRDINIKLAEQPAISDSLLQVGGANSSISAATIRNASSSNAGIGGANGANNKITYENATYGIRIQYPRGWIISGNDTNVLGRNINVVDILSPDRVALLRVSHDTINQNETPSVYLAEIIQTYREDPSTPDFTLISTDTQNTQLAGLPAYQLIYTNRVPINTTNSGSGSGHSNAGVEGIFLNQEIGTIVGNDVYYITYNAPVSKFSLYQDAINEMIASLQIRISSLTPTGGGAQINSNITRQIPSEDSSEL